MVEEISARKAKTQARWNRYNCARPIPVNESISQRVYAVRLALGDGWKNPLPMAEFAELLNGAGTRYDSSVISRIENGERKLTLADVERIAAVDPERRGKLWLAWGEREDASMRSAGGGETPIATIDVPDELAIAAFAASEARKAGRGRAGPPAQQEPAPAEPHPRRARAAGDRHAPKSPKDRR